MSAKDVLEDLLVAVAVVGATVVVAGGCGSDNTQKAAAPWKMAPDEFEALQRGEPLSAVRSLFPRFPSPVKDNSVILATNGGRYVVGWGCEYKKDDLGDDTDECKDDPIITDLHHYAAANFDQGAP